MTRAEVRPQAGVVSPLLANICLHYVFDPWAERRRRHHAKGNLIPVRYADDMIAGFRHQDDAERLQGMRMPTRRRRKHCAGWARINRLAGQLLPEPRICHPWPRQRFAVKHPSGSRIWQCRTTRFCAAGAQ